MPDITKIEIEGTRYDIADEACRNAVSVDGAKLIIDNVGSGPADAVSSVNGKTGNVNLTAIDIQGAETTTNKTTSISASSTDVQYPSAKAVYTYIQSLDGNGVSY